MTFTIFFVILFVVFFIVGGGVLLAWFILREPKKPQTTAIVAHDPSQQASPPPQKGWWMKRWESIKGLGEKSSSLAKHSLLYPTYLVFAVFHLSSLTVGYSMTTIGGIPWWALAILAAVLHTIASIKVVGARENGVVVFFGRIIKPNKEQDPLLSTRHFTSGAHFIPWPMKMLRFTRNEVVLHFGTALSEETLRKANVSSESQSWFVDTEPIRLNFGLPSTEEDRKKYENSPYGQELTTDPHLYVTMEIWDPATYYETVGESIEEGNERIIATSIRAMQEMAGKTFVGKARDETDKMSDALLKKLEELVGDPDAIKAGTSKRKTWGVNILEAGIKDLGISKTINISLKDRGAAITKADGEAIARVRTAKSTKESTELIADGDFHKVTKDGEAQAKKIKDIGNATAGALLIKAASMNQGGEGARRILESETLRASLENANYVIVPTDIGGMVGAAIGAGAQALGKTLAGDKTSPKTPPPTPPAA